MDLREIEWSAMEWIDLAEDRDQWRALVNMVMNLLVPYNFGNFLSSCTTGSFSRRAELREVSMKQPKICLLPASRWVLAWLILRP
jgi:hypothetical protein